MYKRLGLVLVIILILAGAIAASRSLEKTGEDLAVSRKEEKLEERKAASEIHTEVEIVEKQETDRKMLAENTVKQGIAQVEPMAEQIKAYSDQKVMYLTFDDGPSKECTEMVLNILREKNVKATFFLIGEYVEKYPEVARRIVKEGHAIGIHCYRHDYSELYQSTDSYLADFQKAQQVIYEVTGVETKLFRFPGGSVNAYNQEVCSEIIEEMTNRGYVYFDWNASLEDVVGEPGTEALLANAKNSTLGRDRVVMLAHDRVYNTAVCLSDLIDQFPEYVMKPLTDKVKPVQFRVPDRND